MPSWLKKVGEAAVAIGKGLPLYGPIIDAIIPGKKDDAVIAQATSAIDPLLKIITDVEAIGQSLSLPGDQRLTAATTLVAQALAPYAAKFGIQDPALFQKAASELAQGTVDFANSLKAPTT